MYKSTAVWLIATPYTNKYIRSNSELSKAWKSQWGFPTHILIVNIPAIGILFYVFVLLFLNRIKKSHWYENSNTNLQKFGPHCESKERGGEWGVWQYGLWNFQTWDAKLERFLPKNQHTQRKILNFEFWVLSFGFMASCQKYGIILVIKKK